MTVLLNGYINKITFYVFYSANYHTHSKLSNRICGVMVSVLALSTYMMSLSRVIPKTIILVQKYNVFDISRISKQH